MAANRFLSIPYLLLRSTNAGTGLLAGLLQTFVFARILDPERFSVFILIGTLGMTLWLFDLGMAKIVFVRLRAWCISATRDDAAATRYAAALVGFYGLLSLLCTVACFVAALLYFRSSALHSLEIALFFLFSALTLVWFAIRNISLAVDDFIFFESLEAARRALHIGIMLTLLIGIPLISFLIIANIIWMLLFSWALRRLQRRGAVDFTGFRTSLRGFFHDHRREILQTGTYAANEFYLYNFPYVLVPAAFGLGAPTIILDTTFKVFRGSNVLYSAGCDVAVPRQTRAYNEGDRKSLLLATLMAAALCSLPCLGLIVLLAFFSDLLFAVLLGKAAVMPQEVSILLIILLIACLIQTVSNFLLVHTGFFKLIANLSILVSVGMTIATVIAVLARVDLTGFLTVYTAIYVASALCYLTLAIRGPLRLARR